MSELEESAWEHQEEVEESAKALRHFVEAMEQSPALVQKIIAAQRHALEQDQGVKHYCPLCRRKREFVAYMQVLAGRMENLGLGVGGLACAFRTPATRLAGCDNLAQAAFDLMDWYVDSVQPAAERTIPKPAWYSTERMAEDGHE